MKDVRRTADADSLPGAGESALVRREWKHLGYLKDLVVNRMELSESSRRTNT